MSYPDQAAARRPGAVVSAAAVLLLMALGAVVYAVATLLVASGTVDRFRASAQATGAGGGQIDDVVSLLRGSTALSAVVGVVMGLVLVGLALGLLSGRPGARVTTWVVSGLGLFCGCCGLAVLVGQRAAPLRVSADGRATADLLAQLGEAYPGWWVPVNAAVSVGQVLGYLVAAALLTLPAAGAFFHRRPVPVGPTPATGPVPPAYGSSSPWGPPPPPAPPTPPPPSTPPGSTSPPEDRP
ncbi:hypothetical protein [Micromonospora sp. NPDC005806]|uniref:hypothetical protein n=1 Tax=Micromonospora sp. NPDC005806 TaxID=3364234 RepID=UPI0036A9EF7E